MTSLKNEPAGQIRTLDEFFALAHAIETDAAARYAEVARQLKEQGAAHLAEVFERLVEVERGHVREVMRWAARRGESAIVDALPPWPIPDTFDASPHEIAQSKLLTPYRALASAVRHEERAFAFWTYVAAHAATSEIRRAAEQMAMEELDHVSMLRRERRKAFHAQRSASGAIEMTASAAELAAEERRLAELIERDRTAFPNSELTQTIVAASRGAAAKLDKLEARHHPTLPLLRLSADLRNDPLAVSELLVEAYLILADTAKNAKVLTVGQDLARAALYRLARLRAASGMEPDSGQKDAEFRTPPAPLPGKA